MQRQSWCAVRQYILDSTTEILHNPYSAQQVHSSTQASLGMPDTMRLLRALQV
jgi:hypothetical protein